VPPRWIGFFIRPAAEDRPSGRFRAARGRGAPNCNEEAEMSTRNWVIVAVVAVVAVIIIGAFVVDCGDSTETTTTTAAPSD
jgi:hypothetical protein